MFFLFKDDNNNNKNKNKRKLNNLFEKMELSRDYLIGLLFTYDCSGGGWWWDMMLMIIERRIKNKSSPEQVSAFHALTYIEMIFTLIT